MTRKTYIEIILYTITSGETLNPKINKYDEHKGVYSMRYSLLFLGKNSEVRKNASISLLRTSLRTPARTASSLSRSIFVVAQIIVESERLLYYLPEFFWRLW